MKRKTNLSKECQASNVTIHFGLGYDLDWMLNMKYLICYISRTYGPIATKRKMFISIECYASNEAISF